MQFKKLRVAGTAQRSSLAFFVSMGLLVAPLVPARAVAVTTYAVTMSPTAFVQDKNVPVAFWSSKGQVVSSNDQRASALLTNIPQDQPQNYVLVTSYLTTGGYGFAIPAEATILGVEAQIERNATSRSATNYATDYSIRLIRNGVIKGADRADHETKWPFGSDENSVGAVSYGGASDLWKLSLTPAVVNTANFGIAVSAIRRFVIPATQNLTVNIDHVALGITYQVGDDEPVTVTASPTTVGEDAAIPVSTWGALSNIASSDNQGSGSTLHNVPQDTPESFTAITPYVKASGFGFAIPANATITGIELGIERQATSKYSQNFATDYSIRLLKNGILKGADRGDHTTKWPFPSEPSVAEYGSSTDDWNLAWTPADINDSDFGVAYSAARRWVGDTVPNLTVSVDHVFLTVTYTLPLEE